MNRLALGVNKRVNLLKCLGRGEPLEGGRGRGGGIEDENRGVVVGNLIGSVFFLPSFLSEKAVSLSLARFTCVVLFEWVGVDG